MPLIVYMDETGDHSLETVDTTFPLFAVIFLVCDSQVYIESIVPTVYRLKIDYFGHEGVILHSRDIRKRQGDFKFLLDPTLREPFFNRINQIMSLDGYSIIASVIHKEAHRSKYGIFAQNPYDLAVKFALERLLPLLENLGQDVVTIVAEARGKLEDDSLRLSFYETVNHGTVFIRSERFQKIQFHLVFRPKGANIIGTQMADLVGYPIARYVLDPSKPNPAYEIIKGKFYKKGPRWITGLKIFPSVAHRPSPIIKKQ